MNNDQIILDEVKDLRKDVRRLMIDVGILKAKAGWMGGIFGTIFGAVAAIVMKIIFL